MKRLIQFLFGPRLRNKAGGMAWIRGLSDDNGSEALNGRAVRTESFQDGKWLITPTQRFVCTRTTRFIPSGLVFAAGRVVEIIGIADQCLEPWKDDGVTESEVSELFSPRHKEVPMSTEQKHRILRAIAQGPQSIRKFDNGNFGTSPANVRLYVAEMESAGQLVHRDDDTLMITPDGLEAVNSVPSIASLRTHSGARDWQPPPWVCPRASGNDHKRYKSLS